MQYRTYKFKELDTPWYWTFPNADGSTGTYINKDTLVYASGGAVSNYSIDQDYMVANNSTLEIAQETKAVAGQIIVLIDDSGAYDLGVVTSVDNENLKILYKSMMALLDTDILNPTRDGLGETSDSEDEEPPEISAYLYDGVDGTARIHQDIEYLRYCRERIRAELDKKGLRLSPKKTQVQPVTQPVHFLGFSFRLNKNGRVTMRILPEKVSHERRKLRRLVGLAKAGVKTRAEVDKCYEAFRAHAKKGDNRGVVRKMDKFYENLWEEHQNETSHNQGTTHGGTSNARSPRG